MIPTAALLRFGLNNGKGRTIHPLAEDAGSLPSDVLSSPQGQRLAGESPATGRSQTSYHSQFATNNSDANSSSVDVTIKQALSFLSRVAAHSSSTDSGDDADTDDNVLRLTCTAAANHLLQDNAFETFDELRMLWGTRMVFEALDGVVQLTASTLTDDQLRRPWQLGAR